MLNVEFGGTRVESLRSDPLRLRITTGGIGGSLNERWKCNWADPGLRRLGFNLLKENPTLCISLGFFFFFFFNVPNCIKPLVKP